MPQYRELTDDEWKTLVELLPELFPCTILRGGPPTNTRTVLNGALRVIVTGSSWAELPPHYPPYQTCHRRFKQRMERAHSPRSHTYWAARRMPICWGKPMHACVLAGDRRHTLHAAGLSHAPARHDRPA